MFVSFDHLDMSTGYDTKYAKSFRHFTREALPRLDNYRNIMSIQAAYRPTLDELHNATLQGKVGKFSPLCCETPFNNSLCRTHVSHPLCVCMYVT